MDLLQALESLDHSDDSLWTTSGLPVVEKLRELTGNPELNRKEITNAAPEFVRQAPVEPKQTSDEPAEQPVQKKTPKEQVDELDHAINDLILERDAIDSKIAQLSVQRDRLHRAAYTERSDAEDTAERLAYIRQQNANRAAKVAARNKALAVGLTPQDIDPRSPIDRAMGFKRGFGGQRPQVPQKT